MSIKIEKTKGKVRIYEDARIYFYVPMGSMWLLTFLVVISNPGTSSAPAIFWFLWLILTVGWWFVIRHRYHASITLDATRRVLKFSRNWNLNIPSYIVPYENIDRFEMLGHNAPRLLMCVKKNKNVRKPLMEYDDSGALQLAFTMKVMNKYERKLLMEYGDYEEGVEAAVLFGEFTNKPAFGNDGKQIFVPKN